MCPLQELMYIARRHRKRRQTRSVSFALAAMVAAIGAIPLAAQPTRGQVIAEHDASPADESAVAQTPTTSPAGSPDGTAGVASEPLDDISLLSLEIPEVVVSVSRREQVAAGLPYALSVVTAEDIRRSGARNVPDALRLVPGVDVAETSFINSAVSVRGMHGILTREVLVLVDGRQIFDSLFGGTLWGNWPFAIEDIERIEVIRGPGGVIWGANAMNGVINIITKDPGDEPGLTVTGGGGSRGWHKEHTGYSYADEKLQLRVSGEYEAGDGFIRGGSFVRSLDDNMKAGRANVKAIYDAGPYDRITLSGGSAITDGFPATPLASLTRTRNGETQASYIQTKWDHTIAEDNRFQLGAYVNDYHGSPAVHAIDYRYQQLGLQFSHSFSPAHNHTLTWGIDGKADLTDAGNADPYMLTKRFVSTGIIGLYLQDEWRFAPRWQLTMGGRLDYEFYAGFQPSGRIALSYDLADDALVYAAVSRAVQIPPAGSRFLNIPFLGGLGAMTSNADVKSEYLISYELGYRATLFEKLRMDANLFAHSYENLTELRWKLGPPGLLRMNFQNGYDAWTYGLELESQYELSERITLLGNYTLELLEDSGPASFEDSDYMSIPKHKFMLGVRYDPTDDLHLSSHLYYVDHVSAPNPLIPFIRSNVPSYLRWDVRAEQEFWDDRASIAVGVRNLLDNHHPEGYSRFQNAAEVPRLVYAEMRIHLDP